MKAKQMIFKIFVISLIVAILPIVNFGSLVEAADDSIEFEIQYKKHTDEDTEETGKAYSYNTSSDGVTNHPIFQLIGTQNGVKRYGYYCLNAIAGATWMGQNYLEKGEIPIEQKVTYDESYDLTDPETLEKLREDKESAYGKFVNSKYFNQILWILKNMYVPTGDDDVDNAKIKQLLSDAGIKEVGMEFYENGVSVTRNAYKYVWDRNSGFENYFSQEQLVGGGILDPSYSNKGGWLYYAKTTNEFTPVLLPTELVEVAQQAAIWYYANYLDDEAGDGNEQYDVREQGLRLNCSDEISSGTAGWPALSGLYEVETNVIGNKVVKGKWYQDQATILCWYLIDAAEKYGNINETASGEPAKVVIPANGKLYGSVKSTINNEKSCYVLGPIKISGNTPYTLSDTINVNSVECTDYFILTNEKQTTATSGNLSTRINEDSIKQNGFYIAIPDTYIENINNLEIDFKGQYSDSQIVLWKDTEGVEQPIATQIPVNKDFNLKLTAGEKIVDLALTKFITAVSTDETIEDGEYITADKHIGSKENPYLRATSVNTTPLKNWTMASEKHDAIYTQVKTPLLVPEEAYVLYNIRVYNEGEVDVYAGEIEDQLPDNLEYVDCAFNTNYRWKLDEDGKTVRTDFLSYEVNAEENLMKAFDKDADDGKGSKLDYKDVQILCKVKKDTPSNKKLINTAEVSKYQDKDGKEFEKDIDSTEDNRTDENQEKRQEDDDDWEVVYVNTGKTVDLALTKFITAISTDETIEDGEYITADKHIGSKENPYLRATSVDTTPLKNWTIESEKHDAIYEQVKTPLLVPIQSYVLYNIRVYNEGEVDVYAGEIEDQLPDNLEYVDCAFNTNYRWKLDEDGKTVRTDFLSYEVNAEENLMKAFDKDADDGKGSKLDYRDVQILCRVSADAPAKTKLINTAEVSKYQDKDGEEFEEDIDSKEDNRTDENQEKRQEDDDDWEVVLVQTFDLSLLKWVSTVYVTEDGETTTTETGNTGNDNTDIIPKVEINKKKLDDTVVRFGYTIQVTNEGEIAGYAKEITDYVPAGLKFYEEDNTGWTDEGNNVISTRLLENKLLQPGESAQVTVILRWINGADNLNMKTNIAEISEDYNEYGAPDIDSDPDNKKGDEDDIDDASVLLALSTGIIKTLLPIMGGTFGILIIVGLWTVFIKKYVI